MEGPLANNTLGKWLRLIRRGDHQAVSEDIRWAYDPVPNFWPDIESYSDFSDDGSSNEVRKYQENPDDQE